MYDVCIIGSGPAGSTLARLIGERFRVLLVDSRDLEAPVGTGSAKVCGGLLAPKAQKELARQGLGVPGDVVLGPQLFAVRTVDVAAGLERLYQRFYINVDRDAFDRWLVSRVPARVERAWGWTATGIDIAEDGALVSFRTSQGGAATALCRLVVGADGARSVVRRALDRGRALPPRYAAVQAAFSGSGSDPYYGAVFDSALTDFYGWTIPKGDTTLVGAAFPVGARVPERFDQFVERVREAGFRFGSELRRESAMVVRPSSLRDVRLGCGRVVLLGEAAGLISPSSAEGISYALRSGRLLAGALEPGIDACAERYRRAAMPVVADVLGRVVKSSAIYGPATRRLVMRTGLLAIPDREVRDVGPAPGTAL
jgi:flavin-dependent dehydrogenase